MRLMLIVVTVAVAMLLDLRVSQAAQMPWCADTNIGGGVFHYNCTARATGPSRRASRAVGTVDGCSTGTEVPGPTFARLTASPITCPAIVGPSMLFSAPR